MYEGLIQVGVELIIPSWTSSGKHNKLEPPLLSQLIDD
jgi:hypothetical protein